MMDTNNTGEWRELFDVALFEPNRVKLRKRIEHARRAITIRLGDLMTDRSEIGSSISERIALNDALTTLAELQRIVYARKSGANVSRPDSRAAS